MYQISAEKLEENINRFPTTKKFLFPKNYRRKKDFILLLEIFRNEKYPKFVENLLERVSGITNIEKAFEQIRENPTALGDQICMMIVAAFYYEKGGEVEYLATNGKAPDLRVSFNHHVFLIEVKRLRDVSRWDDLGMQLEKIMSPFALSIFTEYDLYEKQVTEIVDAVREALRNSESDQIPQPLKLPFCEINFYKIGTKHSRTLYAIQGSEAVNLGKNGELEQLKKLIKSKLDEAIEQLLSISEGFHVVAFFSDRWKLIPSLLEDILYGGEKMVLTLTKEPPIRIVSGYAKREKDGLFYDDAYNDLEAIVLFRNGKPQYMGVSPSLEDSHKVIEKFLTKS